MRWRSQWLAALFAIGALPLAVLVLNLPFWVGVAIALALLAILGFPIIGNLLTVELDAESSTPDRPNTLMDAVVADARCHVARLRSVNAPHLRPSLEEIANAADLAVSQGARGEPITSSQRRLFSYYLPKAADLAEALPSLTALQDMTRLDAVAKALSDIASLVAETEAEGRAQDLAALDLELRLLEDALKQDRAGGSR